LQDLKAARGLRQNWLPLKNWLREKVKRLVFLFDALFEAVQTLGVIGIILATRWVVLRLAVALEASADTQKFVGWFVLLIEIILVVACFGVNLPFVLRDIQEAWRRAFPKIIGPPHKNQADNVSKGDGPLILKTLEEIPPSETEDRKSPPPDTESQ